VSGEGAAALEVTGLRKAYGDLRAVDGITFAVRAGEVLGLVGPNGAGKTTTLRCLAGIVRPTTGRVRIAGHDLAAAAVEAKRALAFLPDEPRLFEYLTVKEHLNLVARLYGVHGWEERTRALLAELELSGKEDALPTELSRGMKQKLSIACGFLHDPQLILLDEPTVGIDPQSRNAIFDNLEALRARGKSLVYTTHYMEEAERLCDRIVIVDHGRVIANDTVRGLYGLLPASRRLSVELRGEAGPGLVDALRALPAAASAEVVDGVLTVALDDLAAGAPAVLSLLQQRGVAYDHVVSERGDLETVFLTLTGRSLRD
jgi:ABC-2 type transport system ATP-binding protein